MKILLVFFIRYLLIPLLVIIFVFILNSLTKLKIKKVILFILLSSLILVVPSLLGLLKNEFVWGGLLLTVILYLFLGLMLHFFLKTKTFKAMGFNNHKGIIFFTIFIILILTMWIYFLLFEWLSELPYSIWVMLNVTCFTIPVLYSVSHNSFLNIPKPFYTSWVAENNINYEYWEKLDTFKLIQVTVKIKRKSSSKSYSSFSVKLPAEISLGEWFDKLVEDQNIINPNKPIETTYEDDSIDWIFYTSKWFKFPLFTRVLDPYADNLTNKIRNKQTVYIRRTIVNNNNDE